MQKTYFNWSSGKDSSIALYHLLNEPSYSNDLLLTTISEEYNRVTMHGTPQNLVKEQAKSIGIPLKTIIIPKNPTMDDYNHLMQSTTNQLKENNFTHAGFGDIFLEDLKKYREKQLQEVGIQAVFPLWKRNTQELINEFISLGFKAKIVCINNDLIPLEFLGEDLSINLIKSLPKEIDPCGENGEFHTFCYDGPIFNYPIKVNIGKKVIKTYPNPSIKNKEIKFGFCDLL